MAKSQTTTVQETQGFEPVGTGVSFQGGVMHIAGNPQIPNRVENWESSNGLTQYTTVEWVEPGTGIRRTSCNCPGWTNKKSGKARSCCHTKDMEGTKACNKKRLGDKQIRSLADAVNAVPDIVDGKHLRGIDIDWDD